MMKEIGSFFEFPDFDCEKYENSVYANLTKNDNYLFFRDGRSAIKALLLQNKIKTSYYLPAYLCHSILQPFKELNLNTIFYHHENQLLPLLNDNIKNSFIFLLDYFGTECIPKKNIQEMLDNGNTVMLDITHSLFNQNRFSIDSDEFFMISSLRKIFPIPDGGILYYKNDLEIQLDYPYDYQKMLESMIMKNNYIKHSKNEQSKKSFLSIYKSYEEKKDKSLIKLQEIPLISTFILKNIDYKNILKKRWENLKFLHKNLEHISTFNLNNIKSPFTLPISLVNNESRESLRKIMISNLVFPPVHWDLPKEVNNDFFYEKNLSERILSLPIDQRYGIEDMNRVSKLVNNNIKFCRSF